MGDRGKDEAWLTKLVCNTLEKGIFLLCLLTLSEGVNCHSQAVLSLKERG